MFFKINYLFFTFKFVFFLVRRPPIHKSAKMIWLQGCANKGR